MDCNLFETDVLKSFRSKDLNYNFNKKNGYTETWGKTVFDDPDFSLYGNMILDIEITDICNGVGDDGPCKFCYKSNTNKNTSNMSFEMFKSIINKMPKYNNIPILQQLAIGADAQGESNPDMWKMMDYSRSLGIIPNITVADISDEVADKLVEKCGAVAVSVYSNKNYCYDSIKKLTDRGLNQVNMHIMVSKNTINNVYEIFKDYMNGEKRLKGVNAFVLLSLKQKGRGKGFIPLSQLEFKDLVDFAMEYNIPIGFDSCSQPKFIKSIKNRKDYKKLEMLSEPCESTCFSAYINSKGMFYPCSFCENQDEWKNGLDVNEFDNFIDIWNHQKTINFRQKLLDNKRNCIVYNI